ncbi:redox-sensing transcriptional repressor [Breznakia blatticola]|uniref:Redox-sensing transcriptional repressor Rex n=2 Tax=Erysipelotrichaceae TaxID=128827 RepID=A0A4R8A458_9FIRM|nr:redox-sensing transcriptional repressor [Breznakia sp. PF1-11]MDH6417658.1 redox-sensing transcriptional repressor [Breznakia sp. PFB1-4]MDH6420026.1 redox-sensing transcriptional repressor [Breznakia sp. PFB1-12]MDH6475095.1 redox-sensing transcriptional repressor [Breznakia sp. PFB2-30]MDH6477399.1 redox-sensing transcriptional repressor [Breznakia sp. PFB1-19]TDW25086.1 redox-sensing transcriptional repressor [Breznakia blatticola]
MLQYTWVINMESRKVPKATLQRYPVYLKALRRLKKYGNERIMSKDLSALTGIESTTIRRDFSLLGNLGKQGYGYDIDTLIEIFNEQLGVDFDEKIILVGAGNLGRALLKYNNWDHVVGEIAVAFDSNPDRQGTRFGVPVYPIDELEKEMPEGCRIAILAISDNVQQTVDRLIANGIRGIVDFTHKYIQVPDYVSVKVVDVVSSIQELVFETNAKDKKGE